MLATICFPFNPGCSSWGRRTRVAHVRIRLIGVNVAKRHHPFFVRLSQEKALNMSNQSEQRRDVFLLESTMAAELFQKHYYYYY
eukprot:scaffold12877_cov84-Cylindrotheca_fusiformis.AAC.4